MDYEFIEGQITETKSDLVFHEAQLKLALATQEALEALDSDENIKLKVDARDNVKWYGKRIDHDLNMLDVLYSARDLTKK
jgi:hypothetical protein